MIDSQEISAIIAAIVAIATLIVSSIGNIILFFSNRKVAYKNIEMQSRNHELSVEISKASNDIQEANSKLESLDNQKSRINTYISDNRVEWMQSMKKYITEYLDEVYKYDSNEKESFDECFQKIKLKTAQIKLHLNYLGNADKNILNEISALNRILELKHMEDEIKNICPYSTKITVTEEEIQETIMSLRKLENYYILTDGHAFRANDDMWKQLIENHGDSRLEIKEIYLQEILKFNEFFDLKSQLIIIYAEVYLKTEWERVKYEIENGNYKSYNFDDRYTQNLEKVQYKIDYIEKFIREDILV
ncbi:hypothetical protein [Clostridium drakei]|uniref:Uncharacterized protein n=1 Tax=Clostridium drakei TaxID=332101 RepID=A0A2U8DPN4_9CLOT|nr:hypothetical protein [Clostridium drakei]AWI04548.1 hypothetical protein B9W14_08590 [Clostridium drakei]